MIECLHQKPEATHGLLMDDDIMILPESIFRTYQLLRFMKPEFQTAFIGGAMLLLEDKDIQHEDSGNVRDNGYWGSIKPKFNHAEILDNLKNEQDYSGKENTYQAWAQEKQTIVENKLHRINHRKCSKREGITCISIVIQK